jgi:hypothetical protein
MATWMPAFLQESTDDLDSGRRGIYHPYQAQEGEALEMLLRDILRQKVNSA